MTIWETAFCVTVAVIIMLLFVFGPGFFTGDDSDSDSDGDYGSQRGGDYGSQRGGDRGQVARDMQRRSDTGTAVLNANAARRYEQVSAGLAGYSDYNSVMQYIGLEPEVFESHANYTTDMNRMSLGPSTLSERSDPNDLHKWTLRPPDYSVYADENARTEHSEIPDQMRSRVKHCHY